MSKKNLILISVFLFLAAALFSGCTMKKSGPISRTGFYFDTVISIAIYDSEDETILDGCMKMASHYDQLFSAQKEGSDIWNVNHAKGKPVTVDSDTADLLQKALYYARLSGGRFDPTLGGVSSLWNFNGQTPGPVPAASDISAALTHVGYQNIGLSGNTGSAIGSSLHLECLYNGEYYNPLFYFEVGEGTLYGEGEDGISQDPGDVDAPDAFSDAKVQALMNEAKKYVGRAYVWGGSTPTTGFDCSGFVKWSVEHSGFSTRTLPHSAQGIYNMCARVSAADAKPGDFIFFTGTYHTSNPVTHIGIYCGDEIMLHCGDPIKYSNINTSYWQSHFYAYGRLR